MANLEEQALFEPSIYQLEVTDYLLAGKTGIDNLQAQQLANRTQFLKGEVDTLKDSLQPATNAKAGISKFATDSEASAGTLEDVAVNPKQVKVADAALQESINTLASSVPISAGYAQNRRYRAGEFVYIGGNYYECYHPSGSLNKDPRDPTNRPEGWTNTDQSQPYHWIKIGKFLSLPEIGVALPFPTLNLREGIIKYNGDANLHKDKFWRLAHLYPNLISNNKIAIADLRAMVIRGLDDGRGIDVNRVLLSYQQDMQRKITGQIASTGLTEPTLGAGSGAFKNIVTVNELSSTPRTAIGGSYWRADGHTFDSSRVVPTGPEGTVKNISKLFGTRF